MIIHCACKLAVLNFNTFVRRSTCYLAGGGDETTLSCTCAPGATTPLPSTPLSASSASTRNFMFTGNRSSKKGQKSTAIIIK